MTELLAPEGERGAPTLAQPEFSFELVAGAPAAVVGGLSPNDPTLWTRGIRRRRSAALMGYTGLNGMGKTFAMVRDSLPSLAMGRRILSTVAILDPHTGNNHPLYTPFTSWLQLDDFRDGDILLDEVTGAMDSRDSSMPKKVRKQLPQQRRVNNRVAWTGIDWDNSDRRLRQITKAVTKCAGHFPDHSLTRSTGTKDIVTMWAPNRLFVFTTFDASKMTQSDDGKQLTQDTQRKTRARVLGREFVRGPGSIAFKCYNTLDSVHSIDSSCPHVDQHTGKVCGGRIPDKVCKGHTA